MQKTEYQVVIKASDGLDYVLVELTKKKAERFIGKPNTIEVRKVIWTTKSDNWTDDENRKDIIIRDKEVDEDV